MIGQRYLNGNLGAFRCRAVMVDGSQCRCRATSAVSYVMLCKRHRNTLVRHKKPLSFVELIDSRAGGGGAEPQWEYASKQTAVATATPEDQSSGLFALGAVPPIESRISASRPNGELK